MERKWWTLAGGLRRDLHAPDRRHDRQRRAAGHPERPRRELLEPAMGHRRLRADPGVVPARRRLGRRPDRPPARLQLRVRAVHGRVVRLRALRRPDGPQLRPRRSGRGRRGDVRDRAGADRAGVRGPRARQRDRHLGRHGRRRRGHRAAARQVSSPRASAGSGSSSSTCRSGSRAIVLTETKLANVKATDPQPIDWAGVVTFSASLFLLIFGLIRGNPEGWGSADDRRLAGRRASR